LPKEYDGIVSDKSARVNEVEIPKIYSKFETSEIEAEGKKFELIGKPAAPAKKEDEQPATPKAAEPKTKYTLPTVSFVASKDFANAETSDAMVSLKEKHNKIKEEYKVLKQIADCIWT